MRAAHATAGDQPPAFAYLLDGAGGATPCDPGALDRHVLKDLDKGFAWLHVERSVAQSKAGLARFDLDETVHEALLADETRPRCTVIGEGVILNLRGVNLNPGAEPEDMVSLRLWIEDRLVIGVWLRPLAATGDMRDALARGKGPATLGDFVSKYVLRLADHAEPVTASLNERLDALEESLLKEEDKPLRAELADIRAMAIDLRRFMFPQRDALTTLQIEDVDWLNELDRSHIRDAADRVIRLAEELDAIRDRAELVHDQIMDKRAEQMNQRMLVLSIVAAIFLPLGLVTGMLGMNVGGIPGEGWGEGFIVTCLVLLAVAGLQVVLFKWMKLF
ncbi:zinc transporter ZntB [Cucumibacter marinus]|uniref:zinc transporter ZntB n=1 Tax=Cucumibacter marinus TaxID=1121252 RepID=UPI0003FA85CC|nr:zinc transporter ZntB [Cucumibacter marinus]